jgi:hypothetical protein
MILFLCYSIGRTSKAGEGKETFIVGFYDLTVGHILEESVTASSQDFVAVQHRSIRFPHPLPDVSGHIIDAKGTLVKGLGSDLICVIKWKLVDDVSAGLRIRPPGVQRRLRTWPPRGDLPFILGWQALVYPMAVDGSLGPCNSLNWVILPSGREGSSRPV